MSTASQLMTADDLWQLPDDGMRHELVRGELYTMPPSGSEHGAIGMSAGARLLMHVQAHDLGVVFNADTGFLIARDPDTVRAADTAFVAKKRIPATGLPKKYFPGAPNLAVEVISPSDTLIDVEEKVHEWLEAGAQMVWVINPRRREVKVYRSPTSIAVLTEKDNLDGDDVVPGFRMRVADLFV